MNITRRELLKLLPFFLIGFITSIESSPNNNISSNKLLVDKRLVDEITKYNLARKKLLINDIRKEISKDYYSEHTFWSGRKLYTFADYYVMNNSLEKSSLLNKVL